MNPTSRMSHRSRTRASLLAAVLLAGVLAGCSQTERNTRIDMDQPGAQPGSQAGPDPRQRTGEQASEAMNYQATADEATATGSLEELPENQSPGYYTQQFDRMGYQVADVEDRGDEKTYDLRKENERYVVILRMAPGASGEGGTGPQRAQTVTVRKFRVTEEADAAIRAAKEKVKAMKAGMKPHEYIPMISRLGTITDYEFREDQATVRVETPEKRTMEIRMDVDPQRRVVQRIETERRAWQLF